MTPYRPVAYQKRGQKVLGQTFDEMLGMSPVFGDILRLVYHSGGTWLGIYVGSTSSYSNLVRGIGWAIGIGMGIAAVLDVVSLAQRAAGTHPEPASAE